MKVGYARVSSESQNPARQIEMLEKQGVENCYVDKLSGRDMNRPKLREMMEYVRAGDIVVVESISRLSRSIRDFFEIVEELERKHVELITLKENIDTSTPQGRFIVTIFAGLAELEREMIRERQQEGIEIAKREGKYKGREKMVLEEFPVVWARWKDGFYSATKASKELGISRSTFYRRVREHEENVFLEKEDGVDEGAS